MKKQIFIFMLLLISTILFGKNYQKESFQIRTNRTEDLLSESTAQMWKNGEWSDSLKYEYIYDNQEQLSQIVTSYQIENTWVDSFIVSYSYDENGNVTEYVVEKNIGGEWGNYYKYSYFYENDLLDLCVYYSWYQDDWLALSQGTYSFDENENIVEEFWQYWLDPETLINLTLNIYTYNSENLLLSDTQQFWSEDIWIDSYKFDYSYYENGKLQEYIYQIFDENWSNVYRYLYEYDNLEFLEKATYYLWSTTWYEYLYSEYIFDDNDNIIEEIWKFEIENVIYNYSRYLNEYFTEDIFYGDVDFNGIIQAFDAASVLQSTVGLITFSSEQEIVADVDGNGNVQAFDASLILQYVIGLITVFPVEEVDRFLSPIAEIEVLIKDDELVFSTKENLFAFELETNFDIRNFYTNFPNSHFENKIALASEKEIIGEFLRIPITHLGLIKENIEMDVLVNTTNQKISLKNSVLSRNEFFGNFPNPFNPSTTFQMNCVQETKVKINIYNLKGKLVKSLINGNFQGLQNFQWNGLDNNNNQVSTGIYFYKVSLNEEQITRKMLIMK